MKTLIYRNKETTVFNELFIQLAVNYSSKLPFTTKEKYLVWVKQWKEDYKIVNKLHRREHFEHMATICVLPQKIERYKQKLAVIPILTDSENARIEELKKQFLADYKLESYFYCPLYLVWYMLIIRKAGKLKARAERAMRLGMAVA